jgi:predicted GNAT family acetyltransferase
MEIDNERLIYRKMEENDLDIFVKLRLEFLSEVNQNMTEKNKVKIIDSLKKYYVKYLSENKFIGIICEYNNVVVSTAFLTINEKPANYYSINGKTGTLLNVYTFPEYRKNGIATCILKILVEEAKKQNVFDIELLATKDGEKLYKNIGFTVPEKKYMELIL